MQRIIRDAAKNGYIRRIMAVYIHQLKDWPHFKWDFAALTTLLAEVRLSQGTLLGKMQSIGFTLREEASLQNITLDIVKSSEIEGQILNPNEVRSSVARRLGIEAAGVVTADRHVEGIVEMMLDATQQYVQPLSDERLYGWQAALFPTGRSGLQKIVTGAWRDHPAHDPMQVISGMMGREKVHFQAPDSALVPDEMYAFLKWFNEGHTIDPITKAAIAHLWFVTIHPFDDGNGRIARAIADLQLSRADGSALRFYSMSAQIRKEKNKYYDILEQTQQSSMDITPWLKWFYECLHRAIIDTNQTLQNVFIKAGFWSRYATANFNDRQKLMLNKILDGYAGRITSHHWSKITGVSLDTAVRDINDLILKQILTKGPEGGRSTNYILVVDRVS